MGKFRALAILLVLTACSGGGSPSSSDNQQIPTDSKVAPDPASLPNQGATGKDRETLLADYGKRVGKDRDALQSALDNTGALDLIGQPAASGQDLEKLSAFLLQTNESFTLLFLNWAKANDIATQPKLDFAVEVAKAKESAGPVLVPFLPIQGMVIPTSFLRDRFLEEASLLGVGNLKAPAPSELSTETSAKMMAALKEAMDQRVTLANQAKAQQGYDGETQVEADPYSSGLALTLSLKLDQQILAFNPGWNASQPALQWLEASAYALPFKPIKAPVGFAEAKKQALSQVSAKEPLSPGDQILKIFLEEEFGLAAQLLK